tara:strand:+ start:280 stop:561 length:282 start_codon:yes stop_codon:yes gene_type:complete
MFRVKNKERDKNIDKAFALYKKRQKQAKDIKLFPFTNMASKTKSNLDDFGAGVLDITLFPANLGRKVLRTYQRQKAKRKVIEATKEPLWKLIK